MHILAAGTWLGSGLAITAISLRTLRAEPDGFPALARPMTWWAGRAHPAAGVVLLLTGPAMVADADLSFSEPWILIALAGWITSSVVGATQLGPRAERLGQGYDAAVWGQFEGIDRVDSVILILIIADMVIKPGL